MKPLSADQIVARYVKIETLPEYKVTLSDVEEIPEVKDLIFLLSLAVAGMPIAPDAAMRAIKPFFCAEVKP